MGFWTIYFGIYGGGVETTTPIPSEGWNHGVESRLWQHGAESRAWQHGVEPVSWKA